MSNLIGKRLGKYQIEILLGSGGMADVYRARHPDLNSNVAIKVIRPEYAQDEGFRARFEREARIVASLNHIHILKVFDYGYEGDSPYMVMPLVEGTSLRDYLRQTVMTLEDIARMLDQIASALDYAHGRDVIHRDIKPHNVLLDESQNVLLADFGIARLVETRRAEMPTLTEPGTVQGTPEYMSPEQAIGAREDIGSASDIYSLGIMLFEMVTGYVPFQGDTASAVMVKHVTEDRPSPRDFKPDTPVEIARVLMRAIAREPEDRYASAGDLAGDFRRAISQQIAPDDATKTDDSPGVPITEIVPPPTTTADTDLQKREVTETPTLQTMDNVETHMLPTVARDPADEPVLPQRYLLWIGVALVALLLAGVIGWQIVLASNLNAGLSADSLSDARTALDTASTLGGDVTGALEPALIETLDNLQEPETLTDSIRLATLYSEYAPPESINAQSDRLVQLIEQRIADDQAGALAGPVRVLAALNPQEAGDLAGDFNDEAVQMMSENDVSRARLYLQAVRLLDEAVPTARTGTSAAISLLNLGILIENDLSLAEAERLAEAEAAYRDALRLDDASYEVLYRLSSLLLHELDDEDRLDEAVTLANRGREDHLDSQTPTPCRGEQQLADPEIFQQTWHCFLLMTTEAGARLERGDSPDRITPLLDDAISLAEANDGFGSRYYTSEAYYYRAQLMDEPDTETLCKIILEHDRTNERQREQARYASDLLGDTRCLPGSG